VHVVASQVVSEPEALSPAALVVPAAHAVHTLELTFWLAAHVVASQVVSAPEASSPAALVVPAAQAAHALEVTFWLAAQVVAVQPPVTVPVVGVGVPVRPALHTHVPELASATVPQLGVQSAAIEPIADVPPYVHAVGVSAVVVLMEVPPAEYLFASDFAILPEPVAEGLATDK
jgi:hypothetical protein